MSKKYIITSINNIICGFLINDGKINEIRAYEPESILGNIYIGHVSNIVQNINSAFVDIKKGLSCYMSLEDYKGKKLRIGDEIAVQLSKEAIKTKAPTVTTKLSLDGEYVVIMLNSEIGVSSKIKSEARREELKSIVKDALDEFTESMKSTKADFGIIVRTKAEDATSDIIREETINLLCKLDEIINKSKFQVKYSCLYEKCPTLVKDISNYQAENIEVITDLYEVVDVCNSHQVMNIVLYKEDISLNSLYGLKNLINKTLNKRVYLKSGAYIIIEHTEAMTVIDVNSGKSIKGSIKEDKVLSINQEAAREIATQLRLRNISGIIVIDFISMKNSINEEILINTLKEAVYYDSTPTMVVDMTRLGLVELTRKRVRKPLYEVVGINH